MLLKILRGFVRDLGGRREGSAVARSASNWVDRGIDYWKRDLQCEAADCFRESAIHELRRYMYGLAGCCQLKENTKQPMTAIMNLLNFNRSRKLAMPIWEAC